VDKEANRSLISVRIQMLMALFGKKVSDEGFESVKRVYCDALEGFASEAIMGGFRKAEQSCERFPTPKAIRELCSECSVSTLWRYTYNSSKAIDPETKQTVPVKIDPETREILYKATDCPEGRAFLARLRELGKKQKSREPGEEG